MRMLRWLMRLKVDYRLSIMDREPVRSFLFGIEILRLTFLMCFGIWCKLWSAMLKEFSMVWMAKFGIWKLFTPCS